MCGANCRLAEADWGGLDPAEVHAVTANRELAIKAATNIRRRETRGVIEFLLESGVLVLLVPSARTRRH